MPDHLVAFTEKVLKIIATRCTIFSLKFTKSRLAAGLCPDPMGELEHSPRPPSCNIGSTSKGSGEEGREGRKWKGREGMGGKEKGGEKVEGTRTPSHMSGYGPDLYFHDDMFK